MKRIIGSLIGVGFILLLWGCSSSRVSTLESENTVLQTEIESLKQRLSESTTANQTLQRELQLKAEELRDAQQELSDLRRYNLVLLAEQETLKAPAEAPPLPSPPPASSGDYESDYNRALGLFHEHRYQDAIEMFSSLLQRDRSHSLSDNCQYWLGECFYAQGQYETALAEFMKVIAFSEANKAADAQFKTALCFIKMQKYPEAREELNHLITAYPKSEYVARAQELLIQIP
ncbi:MAG: tetratricopeptide repeat protein [bacterium]